MDFESDYDRESPFQPGIPVSPDRFIGGKDTINDKNIIDIQLIKKSMKND